MQLFRDLRQACRGWRGAKGASTCRAARSMVRRARRGGGSCMGSWKPSAPPRQGPALVYSLVYHSEHPSLYLASWQPANSPRAKFSRSAQQNLDGVATRVPIDISGALTRVLQERAPARVSSLPPMARYRCAPKASGSLLALALLTLGLQGVPACSHVASALPRRGLTATAEGTSAAAVTTVVPRRCLTKNVRDGGPCSPLAS